MKHTQHFHVCFDWPKLVRNEGSHWSVIEEFHCLLTCNSEIVSTGHIEIGILHQNRSATGAITGNKQSTKLSSALYRYLRVGPFGWSEPYRSSVEVKRHSKSTTFGELSYVRPTLMLNFRNINSPISRSQLKCTKAADHIHHHQRSLWSDRLLARLWPVSSVDWQSPSFSESAFESAIISTLMGAERGFPLPIFKFRILYMKCRIKAVA